MNIIKKIEQLKLNIQQHQAQIQILNKEIKILQTFKSNNSVENVENDVNSNVNVFCFDKVIKPSKKNENLKEFI